MSPRHVHRSCASLWVVALACLSGGCGAGGGAEAKYPSARLEGEVTLDGKPIDEGSIQFVPMDQNAPPTQATILKGRYVAPKVGLGKVTALLSVAPPSRPDVVQSDYVPPPTVTIPDRYKNGLPIEVTGDKADQDFALTSKK